MKTITVTLAFLVIGTFWLFGGSPDSVQSTRSTQASLSDEEYQEEEEDRVLNAQPSQSYTPPTEEELKVTHRKIAELKRIKEFVNGIYMKNMEYVQSDPIEELNAEIENVENPELKELLTQERDWMIIKCGKNFVYYKDCPRNYEIVSYKEKMRSQLQSSHALACRDSRDEDCIEIEEQLEKIEYELPEVIEYSYHNFEQTISGMLASYLEESDPNVAASSGL